MIRGCFTPSKSTGWIRRKKGIDRQEEKVREDQKASIYIYSRAHPPSLPPSLLLDGSPAPSVSAAQRQRKPSVAA